MPMQGYDRRARRRNPRWRFHTGDLVQRDADRVYFVGRRSDMINVGGKQGSSAELSASFAACARRRTYVSMAADHPLQGNWSRAKIVPAAGENAGRCVTPSRAMRVELEFSAAAAHRDVPQIVLSDTGKMVRRSPT